MAGEAVSEAHFRHIVETMKPGATEVMMHPGTDNAVLQRDCLWEHDFEAELAAITSPEIEKLLDEKDIEIINFNDLE